MLTIPIEKARQTLSELAERVATGGGPVVLELSSGHKVLLADIHSLPWLERFEQYKPPSRQIMRESLWRAARLRAAMRAAAVMAEESVVDTLTRIREERLNELTGMR